MFKKFILLFCLIFIGQYSPSFAAENCAPHLSSLRYSIQLKEIVTTIQKLPEVNQLIANIQKEGPISILVSQDNSVCLQFGACWDPVRRIIFVNLSKPRSKGSLIGSILFELHNALVNSQMDYYDELASKGHIEEESYVRSIEYLEYQNSLMASKLACRGIELGIFPTSAYLPTYSSFEEHYHYQKLGGHSACIAYNYNQILNDRAFKIDLFQN